MDIEKYTYQVFWSEDDQQFVATVSEFPSLSWLADTRAAAETGLLELVTEVVEDMDKTGEEIPTPLGERTYSGRFNVRISPSLHRRLVMQSKLAGISLNALVSEKLAG